MKRIEVKDFRIGHGEPLVLIAGPCVIENEKITRKTASFLKSLTQEIGMPFIFKASYDKANRSSLRSFRGPGLKEGLEILKGIRREFAVPVLSDVHRFEEIEPASEVLDIMQVPAFLCRQTDFLVEVSRHAKIVNIKKGQFMAPWDIPNILEKVVSTGNHNIMLTERGTCFGYNNLIADMRSLPIIRRMGYPVVFDATHSVQLPAGRGHASGGERDMVPYLSRSAVASGIDGIFLEVHPDPDKAKCDGPNSLALSALPRLLGMLKNIDILIKEEDRSEPA